MTPITVRKLHHSGAHLLSYTGTVDAWLPNGVRLVAAWGQSRRDLGYTTFEPGDGFIEWFFTDRWYNIFEVRAARTRALKGWYCNVATPAIIGADSIESRDLILDLWVAPNGDLLQLDEAEFAAACDVDASTRAAAEAGLAALLAHVAARQPPFHHIPARRPLA
jgi:hypothetical protein